MGVEVIAVAAGMITEEFRAAALAAILVVDILENSTEGFPSGDLRLFDYAKRLSVVTSLMLTQIEL